MLPVLPNVRPRRPCNAHHQLRLLHRPAGGSYNGPLGRGAGHPFSQWAITGKGNIERGEHADRVRGADPDLTQSDMRKYRVSESLGRREVRRGSARRSLHRQKHWRSNQLQLFAQGEILDRQAGRQVRIRRSRRTARQAPPATPEHRPSGPTARRPAAATTPSAGWARRR